MAGTRFDLDPSIAVLLRDLDISPALVLRRAGLPADLLSRGASELDPADYYRFWEAIAREAERHGTAAEAAVAIGEAISVEHFSPPLFAALSSQDLRTAAERLAVYKLLIGPVALVVDSAVDLTIAFRWPTAQEPPVLLAMAEVLFWVALARVATREPVRPVRVTMPQIPTDPGVLEDHLGARVRVGDAWSVTFSQADSARPFLTENEGMWQVFAPELRRRLADLDAHASTRDRVQSVLVESLPAGDPSIGAVTRRLATSPRTLQRQLKAEGTSFQAVLAETRSDLARHYLVRNDLRTAEIAFLLGYTDTNSFYRAFKTWTGMTPEGARAGLIGAPAGQP
ncbi:AraC family transcriptional regulator [Brevibacterium sp. 2SA]|uniref:AraC family transcriptional regulator n=1 Tax=Brevibacterium sp. 2SA TaxID=2502198 RepID=UPI0010F8F9BD|nr:AraC family transcriptional regulator [Brevibacterium sp. 2SA]